MLRRDLGPWISNLEDLAEASAKAGEPAQGQVAASQTGAGISLNTASQSQLESLPGIGPAYAQRIIENRPYQQIEDLLKIPGIGEKTFAKIKDKISLY